VHGWRPCSAIGRLIVGRLPQIGQPQARAMKARLHLFRHPETAVVEEALRRTISTVSGARMSLNV
jgi:hypothetical protein